jgi:hypothetical protein
MACAAIVGWVCGRGLPQAQAGQLMLRLGNSENVTFVGALARWDGDGNARRPVDPQAKIDAPAVTASAKRSSDDRWVFDGLPPGRYDLVILASPRIRIEGFHYPPVLDFDPFLAHTVEAREPVRGQVVREIARSRHHENRVTPLYLAGDQHQVRVLVQLLRDKPTSFDRRFGAPVATLRHEVWQYTNQYGGWVKERRTKVFDRTLMARERLRRWTWIWQPRLGGIDVAEAPVVVTYEIPRRFDREHVRGLLPY